jgi:hypothetical protein
MDGEHRIKLFGFSHAALERDLDKAEALLGIDLGRSEPDDKDEDYYPQFAQALRQEASDMSEHYEVFYCLERSIRKLVAETLETQHGKTWWDTTVPQGIRDAAKQNM